MPVLCRALCLIVLVGMSALIAYGALYQNGPGQVAERLGPFWGRFVWTDVAATFALFSVVAYKH